MYQQPPAHTSSGGLPSVESKRIMCTLAEIHALGACRQGRQSVLALCRLAKHRQRHSAAAACFSTQQHALDVKYMGRVCTDPPNHKT